MKNENYRICMQCKYIEPECECEEFKPALEDVVEEWKMKMPKMSSYAMLLWVISLVVYFMRNIYLDLINLDVKPIVMFGLALSFPFYLLAKYTEEPSETNDSGKVEE